MRPRMLVLLPLALGVSAWFAACGGDDNGTSLFPTGDDDGSTPEAFAGEGSPPADTAPPVYSDFPPNPIIDDPDGGTGAPSNSDMLFGPDDAGASSGGPCLVEPEVGSLYPNNWLRPRFHWIAPGGENLFELRVHAANQKNDLVVYTAQNK